MKENYRNICQRQRQCSSHNPSIESLVMVPENSWGDVNVEEEITIPMKNLAMKTFPPNYLQYQGTVGNIDTDNNIQKLSRVAYHPESFSFESHGTFIAEDALKAKIAKNSMAWKE